MKLIQAISLALATTLFTACADTKVIKGVEYDTYGLFDKDDVKNPDIQYKMCVGNFVWGVLLFETVVMPIYFFGFSLYEPVGPMPPRQPGAMPKGAVH